MFWYSGARNETNFMLNKLKVANDPSQWVKYKKQTWKPDQIFFNLKKYAIVITKKNAVIYVFFSEYAIHYVGVLNNWR